MDLYRICRFCMAKERPMLNLYQDEGLKAKAIALLPNLKILDYVNLPHNICKHCVHQLGAAFKFKSVCESTDLILKQTLTSMQPIQVNEVPNVPEEIQIDSDDDNDETGNIAEPLVVLSSSADLEDEDPLDLGPGSGPVPVPHPDSRSTLTDSMKQETAERDLNSSSGFESEHRTAKSKWEAVSHNHCVAHRGESFCARDSVKHDAFPAPKMQLSCNESGHTDIEVMEANEFSEHISVSGHFLNEGCEKNQSFEAQKFGCPVCNLPFESKSRLEMHLIVHDGELPYPCLICKKRFAREGGLKAHLKLHSGEKPHVCTVCQKSFSLKGNLKVHLRLHTGEKPFQCTICSKAFTQKISLTKHLSVHRAAL